MITLLPGQELEGTALDEDGKAVSGVAVVAIPKLPSGSMVIAGHSHALGATDAQGHFRLSGLADRDYTLGLRDSYKYVALEAPPVRPGTPSVRLVVRRLVTVRITCLDEHRKPVAGVDLYLNRDGRDWMDPGSGFPRATTDVRGTAFLHGLDARKTYSLELQAKGSAGPGHVEEQWLPKDCEVVMPGK